MSGRGRGGRGGRGSKGYVPPSGAQLYLQRSAQECGLDSRNLRALSDVTRPILYPDLKWHSNGSIWQPETDNGNEVSAAAPAPAPAPTQVKRSTTTVYLIQKQREMHRRVQTSVYNVRPATQEADVVRYRSNSTSRHASFRMSADHAILQHLGKLATPTYFPAELLGEERHKKKQRVHQVESSASDKTTVEPSTGLDELEAQESDGKRRDVATGNIVASNNAGGAATEEDMLGNLSDLDNEEEEEGEDYVMNYYESEEESDGGGGEHEPTF